EPAQSRLAPDPQTSIALCGAVYCEEAACALVEGGLREGRGFGLARDREMADMLRALAKGGAQHGSAVVATAGAEVWAGSGRRLHGAAGCRVPAANGDARNLPGEIGDHARAGELAVECELDHAALHVAARRYVQLGSHDLQIRIEPGEQA